jgi:hypothetical protein
MEIIDQLVQDIEQIIFWLKIGIYTFIGICVIWLIGFVRRSLGIDAQSIELRRIRRILESNQVNQSKTTAEDEDFQQN